MESGGVGARLNALAARYFDGDVPHREDIPRYVAPLPAWLEEFGLRLAWVIVAVNVAGTAFGFYYYQFQFSITDPVMWPLVPDSPVATLFIAASLAAWKLDRHSEVLAGLAFFGCIKLGAWTPFVLLAFPAEYPVGSLAALGTFGFVYEYGLYVFLVTSHLAMVLEAFLIHRYAEFRVGAVAVAAGWYALNDLVDYFVPVVGQPHHTLLDAEPYLTGGRFDHSVFAHDAAAAVAVLLTLTATFLALATRVEKEKRVSDRSG
jgi:uncharacterized membrane protein YpjA